MERIIKTVKGKYEIEIVKLVKEVFTEHSDAEEGMITSSLVQEIRDMDTYVPELELVMVNEKDEHIGYVLFSEFTLDGKYKEELLILTPVAVKTSLQRQHISKDLIEYGFIKAKEMGYKAVIVEGNPQNYKNRGFETSKVYGIVAAPSVGLPADECLMVKWLDESRKGDMCGMVDYSAYKSLV